ncbi:MAG: hypothetical protein RLZZ450_6160 [Pseudomonadota bacterium]|jgi:serine/threonine-protein kinase
MSLAETSQARSFGRYQLIASLGRGGMADVYLASVGGLASFNKLLVLKVLRQDAAPEFVLMFLDEARLSACFNHPNIVQTYEVGEVDGRYFIALEYLDGQSLRAVQRRLGETFPLQDELRALIAVARGLDYAHELLDFEGKPLCVVHRDISPQNVFLTYDGQVKLLDFGIAKAASSAHDTHVGLIKGKVDYIAPEQARGDEVDRRADIFSLGVMAWEAMTGQRFSGGHRVTDVAKLHKRLTGGEPDVHVARPDVPEPLADLIRCAVSLEPADRFATAAEFADAIEEFVESRQVRPSAKTLSEVLAAPYSEVRAHTAATIHEQLMRIGRDGGRESSLLVLSPGDTTSTQTGFAPSQRFDATSPSVPSVALAASQPSPAHTGAVARLSKPAVVVGAVAIAAFFALSSPRQRVDAASHALPAASSATSHGAAWDRPSAAHPATRSSPQAHTVAIAIRVSPESAHVSLDGTTLPSLPFEADLERDALPHRVQASAPGYITKTMVVPFDSDRELSVVLQPDTRAVATRAHPSPARAGQQPSRGPASAHVERVDIFVPPARPQQVRPAPVEPGAAIGGKRRINLSLDLNNPYEN